MTAWLLLILLAGYVVLAISFLLADRGSKRARWLGVAAVVAGAPFFFWLAAKKLPNVALPEVAALAPPATQ